MTGRPAVVLAVTHEVTATTFYRGYLSYLREAGWDVTMVASSSGSLEMLGRDENVRVVHLPMKREPSPLDDLKSWWGWLSLLRSIRPDAVVAATPKASLLATTAARVCRVPVRIYQLWGLRLETEQGLRRSILRLMEQLTASSATLVIANSRSLAEASVAEGTSGGTLPTVLGSGSSHGVDTVRFSEDATMPILPGGIRRFLDESVGRMVVGFVGRLHQDKGIDTLVHAMDLVAAALGDRAAYVLVGAVEDERIAQLVDDAGLRHQVLRIDHVSDPRPIIAAFDVLTLPSLREGFPNVVLEAAALSVPAVTTDATGCIDSVVDGQTGLITRAGDPGSLADALKCLVQDPSRVEAMGQVARRRAVEEFDQRIVWGLQEGALRACVQEQGRLTGAD